MKSRTLIALAAAGACAWSVSAFAAGMHGAHLETGVSVEVQTPSSVNESAPQAAGGAHLGGSQSSSTAFSESPDFDSDGAFGTGATSSVSGSGSVSSSPAAGSETTEYWLIGSESAESNADAAERTGG